MNNWCGIGRIVKQPELKFIAGSGNAVTKFTVAINRRFKKDEADFINCIAFNKTAETIAQYMDKGSQIALTGRIQTGSYDAKDGTKRYTTDIIVDSFEFLSNNKKNSVDYAGTPFDDMDEMPEGDTPF